MDRKKILGIVNIPILITIFLVALAGIGGVTFFRDQTTENLTQPFNFTPEPTPSLIPTPTPSSTPTVKPEQQPTPTPPPQSSPLVGPSGERRIIIALYKLSYSTGETISAIISNDTPRTIYAVQGPSGGSYCRILMIEQKKENNWQETGICGSAMPDKAVEIRMVGSITEVFSFPNSIGNPSSLPSGTYRFRLDYYESDPMWTNNPQKKKVYSQEFQIL